MRVYAWKLWVISAMLACFKYKCYLYCTTCSSTISKCGLITRFVERPTLKVLTVGNLCSCYWKTLDWSFIILSLEACIHNIWCRNCSIINWWVKLRVVFTLKMYRFTTCLNHVLRMQNKSVGYCVSMFWHIFLKCYKNIQHLSILCLSMFLYRLRCVEQ